MGIMHFTGIMHLTITLLLLCINKNTICYQIWSAYYLYQYISQKRLILEYTC